VSSNSKEKLSPKTYFYLRHFQFGFFFGNESMPKLKNKSFQASTDSGSELPSADFLLENVAKIERKYFAVA
jgi:hypothetical protein